jgi:flagellar biosynthesis activator protein FlaF
MYMKHYEQVAEDTSERIRNNEVRAIEHSVQLMKKAESTGMAPREKVEAVFFVNRLWGVLLEDLASRDNELSDELRAKLISIGIWVLRTTEDIRQDRVKSFNSLISISQTIATGLKQNHAYTSEEK